jgi:hypothetical protein
VCSGQWAARRNRIGKERIFESDKVCGLTPPTAHRPLPTAHFLLFIFHHPGQPDYVIAHDFQIGIKPKCAAEAFQGRDRIL